MSLYSLPLPDRHCLPSSLRVSISFCCCYVCPMKKKEPSGPSIHASHPTHIWHSSPCITCTSLSMLCVTCNLLGFALTSLPLFTGKENWATPFFSPSGQENGVSLSLFSFLSFSQPHLCTQCKHCLPYVKGRKGERETTTHHAK